MPVNAEVAMQYDVVVIGGGSARSWQTPRLARGLPAVASLDMVRPERQLTVLRKISQP
ncbi:MAG: hypothetical protein M3P18_21510 [Actinomycetota bacterium]|nr:hypothetical protein [Actinomycetota bacterium]